MRRTPSQRKWDTVQGVISALAIGWFGLAIALDGISLGLLTIAESVPFGLLVLSGAALFLVAFARSRPGRARTGS